MFSCFLIVASLFIACTCKKKATRQRASILSKHFRNWQPLKCLKCDTMVRILVSSWYICSVALIIPTLLFFKRKKLYKNKFRAKLHGTKIFQTLFGALYNNFGQLREAVIDKPCFHSQDRILHLQNLLFQILRQISAMKIKFES